ncbi:hypothetical protein HETIRDRAFT_416935 [Heterobasidion irregulare TC 32-1]|uniref:Uncharacterized protein n=1 Tax=Heterobasidion irregulare (strain TC 32-1) TaxID=747525 RepID=W4KB02_HETIT|nr:uncharacterized protein HETIRDRAFT_416935 [Heterobasidion irregulare TC 32-1]ETW82899.1 hypothetical protein HETIRDRAFT_416935 [Heterobasidion irregulare TC 32-1]
MPPITLISSLPPYISPEEHAQITVSTPASFSDIPSVLRHKEENVSAILTPPVEDFSAEDGAQGTLYVIDSALVFLSSTGRGFQVEYPFITIHALSLDETRRSVYCQLDDPSVPELNDGIPNLRELFIKTQNPSSLEAIYESLSYCVSLHPSVLDEEDDRDDAFIDSNSFETFTGDEDEELSEVGRAALAHLESIIDYPNEHTNEE